MRIQLSTYVPNYGDENTVIDVPNFLGEAWCKNGTAKEVGGDVDTVVVVDNDETEQPPSEIEESEFEFETDAFDDEKEVNDTLLDDVFESKKEI